MKTTRYFTYQQAIWKFEHGKTPQIRTEMTLDWTDSEFASLEEFLCDSGQSLEITAEEAEADPPAETSTNVAPVPVKDNGRRPDEVTVAIPPGNAVGGQPVWDRIHVTRH